MLVSRSPVRISYAGGGSDYQNFFKDEEGCVVSTTINKFVYFISLPQWPLATDRFRFTYRKTESVQDVDALQHPVVRELLRELSWKNPLNMATMADVPGESGLGSSSAFTAAAIQNLYFRLGQNVYGPSLAKKTIELERNKLCEPGGWQDQVATSHGGLKIYTFQNEGFESQDIALQPHTRQYLENRQILVATEFLRNSPKVAKSVHENAKGELFLNFKESAKIARQLAHSLHNALTPQSFYEALVVGVNDHWRQKSKIPMDPSFTESLNQKLHTLREMGSDALKLLGSGDGGYILVLAKPSVIAEIRSTFGPEKCLDFSMIEKGTTTKEFSL